MEQKITFGSWEAVCLLITMISTKAVLNFPRVMAENGGTAGWLLVIYISLLAFAAFFVITRLYSKFEGKDLLDIGESIGGKPVKIVVGIVIIVFLIILSSLILRTFSEEMKIMGLTQSPISFVMLFFAVGMIISVYYGIESIVRFQAILVPISVISFTLFIIALFPSAHITNFYPILGNGVYDIFVEGSLRVSSYAELIFLFLIPPFIKTGENFRKVGYAALGICTLVLLSLTAVFLGAYPYPAAIDGFLPAYQLARMVDFDRFFQRVESILVVTWATIGFMYLSTAFFFIVYVFRKTFDLKYQRPLIWPFIILIFNISLLPASLIETIELDTRYFRNWAWTVTFGFTILILLIGKFVRRNEKTGKKV